MEQLFTVWGETLDKEHVLDEYPRPLMVRDSYLNLNGYWDYAFTQEFVCPKEFDGKILVPFSPEAALSGVNRQLMPNEYLWYHRTFSVDGHKTKRAGESFSEEDPESGMGADLTAIYIDQTSTLTEKEQNGIRVLLVISGGVVVLLAGMMLVHTRKRKRR